VLGKEGGDLWWPRLPRYKWVGSGEIPDRTLPSPLDTQESVHDAFSEALVEAVRKLRLGSGLDAAITHGPLIQPGAVEKVGVVGFWCGCQPGPCFPLLEGLLHRPHGAAAHC
jgi:Aldehyde dehydrogenase family